MKKVKRSSQPDLTPELATNLSENHAGQWVAIRRGELIEVAPTLKELFPKLSEDIMVTVMFVPVEPAADEVLFVDYDLR